MSQSDGVLQTALDNIRLWINKPETKPKYSDSVLLGLFSETWTELLLDLYNNASEKPIIDYDITLAEGTAIYQLPPNVLEVTRLIVKDTSGRAVAEILPRSKRNLFGCVWRLEHNNAIVFDPVPTYSGTITVQYVPSAFVTLLAGTVIKSQLTDTLSFPVGRVAGGTHAITLGEFDRRPNAYVGSVLRRFKAVYAGAEVAPTGYYAFPIQERKITGFTQTSQAATVSPADQTDYLTGLNSSALIHYEVVPANFNQLAKVVEKGTAAKVCLLEGDRTRATSIQEAYSSERRALMLQMANVQSRVPSTADHDSIDNMELWGY